MSCTNCALTINQYLHNKGLEDAKVNFIGAELSFTLEKDIEKEEIKKGIENLGYHIITGEEKGTT